MNILFFVLGTFLVVIWTVYCVCCWRSGMSCTADMGIISKRKIIRKKYID